MRDAAHTDDLTSLIRWFISGQPCASGDNATTVARYLDNAFNPGKRAGSKTRIDNLAKTTRQSLAKLSPAEVEELAASMRQPLIAKIVGSGITTVARRAPRDAPFGK